MKHEEAKKFLDNYARSCQSPQLKAAIMQLQTDWNKIYNTLEQLSEPNNIQGAQQLREHGSYKGYNSPLTVEVIHKLIQDL